MNPSRLLLGDAIVSEGGVIAVERNTRPNTPIHPTREMIAHIRHSAIFRIFTGYRIPDKCFDENAQGEQQDVKDGLHRCWALVPPRLANGCDGRRRRRPAKRALRPSLCWWLRRVGRLASHARLTLLQVVLQPTGTIRPFHAAITNDPPIENILRWNPASNTRHPRVKPRRGVSGARHRNRILLLVITNMRSRTLGNAIPLPAIGMFKK